MAPSPPASQAQARGPLPLEALKELEKSLPDLQKMSVAFMSLGTAEELHTQIIEVAVDRAFLQDRLPADEAAFKNRVEEGRAA